MQKQCSSVLTSPATTGRFSLTTESNVLYPTDKDIQVKLAPDEYALLCGSCDSHSIPLPSTNSQRPTALGWPLSLRDPAGSRGFLRVPADFAHRSDNPFSTPFRSLRPLLLSSRFASKSLSPQAPKFHLLQIRNLLADFSSGWMASLPRRGKSLTRCYRSAYTKRCCSFHVLDNG